ncbi:hypothetical protein HNP55_003199 [Paucibacter oligotrophus]|uniref:DUF7661 domain-containing protein n=1 Tax=Roseateles oligotrophus TaxID=1769250 RepID=A0A840LCL7_9BURK|nr:hypothetical protein [Roseateles oligotrophus]MBB4844655.1 hypothetical protein [Roseateles oligotrophus]
MSWLFRPWRRASGSYRFQLGVQQVLVQRVGSRWQAVLQGQDGQQQPADFSIPDFIAADELGPFLAELLMERAKALEPS